MLLGNPAPVKALRRRVTGSLAPTEGRETRAGVFTPGGRRLLRRSIPRRYDREDSGALIPQRLEDPGCHRQAEPANLQS